MTPFRFDPRHTGARCWLGPFEAAVMAAVWDADGPITIKRVWHALGTHAYTAVATTMVRLTEKGLLTRRRVGYAFVFTPTVTEDEFIETQRGYVLQALEG